MPRSKHRKKLSRYGSSRRSYTSILPSNGEDKKMSAVILEFVEPYRNQAQSDSEFEKLIALSIVAWNMSLLPEGRRENALEDFAREMFSRKRCLPIKIIDWILTLLRLKRKVDRGYHLLEVTSFKEIVNEMIDRKLNRFSQNRRFILRYHVEFTENDMQLFVVSTLEGMGNR